MDNGRLLMACVAKKGSDAVACCSCVPADTYRSRRVDSCVISAPSAAACSSVVSSALNEQSEHAFVSSVVIILFASSAPAGAPSFAFVMSHIAFLIISLLSCIDSGGLAQLHN